MCIFGFAYLIELHRTRDVAVFASQEIATLLGHCFGTGQCGCHSDRPIAHCTHPPDYDVNPSFHWPGRRWQRVGVRACQAQSASTQRHCRDIGDNAIMCLGDLGPLGAWEPGTGRERQSSRPLRHCSIAPTTHSDSRVGVTRWQRFACRMTPSPAARFGRIPR